MNKNNNIEKNNNILIELIEEGDALARELDSLYTKLEALEIKATEHGFAVKVQAKNNQHIVSVLRASQNQNS